MKMSFIAILFASLLALAGCQSTLDREATALNDTMTQRVTKENDQHNADALERGDITETTKAIRDERNHKHRRLARSMARDADDEYPYPVIPTNIEEEPDSDVEPDSE